MVSGAGQKSVTRFWPGTLASRSLRDKMRPHFDVATGDRIR